ncbi:MAG: hypothetical protein ACRDTR_09690 [Rubrobacter sp.]
MIKSDDPRSVEPGTPEPPGVTESEDWAWMVDEDPAFYIEETAQPEKRSG